VKLFQFMTSCSERRQEYAQMSWLDFLGGEDAFSDQFVKLLNAWPEALVAMDAETADARTHGAVLLQLTLDNLRAPSFRDGTLNGPTSIAWMNPWRRYLEAQGVEFIHGKIDGFEAVEGHAEGPNKGKKIIWPTVECYEPRYTRVDKKPALMPGYFVLALPAFEAQRMAVRYAAAKQLGPSEPPLHEGRDLWRMAHLRLIEDRPDFTKEVWQQEDLSLPKPRGQLRHMVGIQYYFDEDVRWLDGHVYLPLSEWGLSAISQVRNWQDKHDWEYGYRGVLSVVFSIFDNPGTKGKNVWECKPEEIAEEVWTQIKNALNADIPVPRYWHLDTNFDFDPKDKRYENHSPYQIDMVGEWERRPGELTRPNEIEDPDEGLNNRDDDDDDDDGQRWRRGTKKHRDLSKYDVSDGIVMAGTHMKTYTRLTTMEAANESGRHAANAILDHSEKKDKRTISGNRARVSPCDIWPIEDREVDDLDFFRDIDRELYRRGLDHFVDILDIADFVSGALRGARPKNGDPFDPLWVLAQLGRITKAQGRRQNDTLSVKIPRSEWE
jgi:hypothetical protein